MIPAGTYDMLGLRFLNSGVLPNSGMDFIADEAKFVGFGRSLREACDNAVVYAVAHEKYAVARCFNPFSCEIHTQRVLVDDAGFFWFSNNESDLTEEHCDLFGIHGVNLSKTALAVFRQAVKVSEAVAALRREYGVSDEGVRVWGHHV